MSLKIDLECAINRLTRDDVDVAILVFVDVQFGSIASEGPIKLNIL